MKRTLFLLIPISIVIATLLVLILINTQRACDCPNTSDNITNKDQNCIVFDYNNGVDASRIYDLSNHIIGANNIFGQLDTYTVNFRESDGDEWSSWGTKVWDNNEKTITVNGTYNSMYYDPCTLDYVIGLDRTIIGDNHTCPTENITAKTFLKENQFGISNIAPSLYYIATTFQVDRIVSLDINDGDESLNFVVEIEERSPSEFYSGGILQPVQADYALGLLEPGTYAYSFDNGRLTYLNVPNYYGSDEYTIQY